MAIDLRDLTRAVSSYFDNKVEVSIQNFRLTGQNPGTDLNPEETFAFKVRIKNADSANGGIRLTKIKIHLAVTPPGSDNPNHGHLKVPKPEIGIATNSQGIIQQPGQYFDAFILDPAAAAFNFISVGETVEIEIQGKGRARGNYNINAKITGEPDLTYLFPNQDTPAINFPYEVRN